MVMNDFRFSLPLSGLVLAAALCYVGSGLIAPRGAERALDERVHHVGNDRVEAWRQMGAGVDPEGTRLDVRFQSRSNDGEWVLAITHREVDELWSVALNGNALGRIRPSKAERTTY